MTTPWSILPAPPPKETSYPLDYFYNNVARDLIKDTVRIMSNGLPIDLNKVQELEKEIDTILAKVDDSLANNPIIQTYQQAKYEHLINQYKIERSSKLKPPEAFLKEFKPSDVNHRSYFMHVLQKEFPEISPPEELLATGVPKWSAKDLKPFSHIVAVRLLLDKKISPTNKYASEAMLLLATHTAEIKNRPYLDEIASPTRIEFPKFSPASPDQKHDVLTDLLGYESESFTKAYADYVKEYERSIKYHKPPPQEPRNKFSWSKDELLLLKEEVTDPNELQLVNDLLDYSMGAIIKNNFIASFYQYTIDGRLHGDYVLLGAKSG